MAKNSEKSAKDYEIGKGKPPKEHSWKKGQSGNKNGKPKGTLSAKTIIAKWLSGREEAKNPITHTSQRMTQLDIITLAQLVKARQGDTVAFNALLDRTEGKAKQVTEEIGQTKIRVVITKRPKK